MKKVILVTGVAVLALASVAAAYTFSANLTVGSQGADVVALQQALIKAGNNISAGATGYFGSQTKAAVKAFQTANKLPSTGFVGPLTRGVLNGTSALAPVSSVPAPVGQGTNGPVGTVVGVSTPGVAGTLAASLWTTPSGVTAYKGQTYDLAGFKLQASASDMSVTSVAFDFSSRFWLYANSITVKDETGAVVGSVSNLNSSNFTELTVGSDYRVTVPVSLVVKATQSKYLTIGASFNAVTDRASQTLGISSFQVRSVDGTGVTDTETVNTGNTAYVADDNGVNVIRAYSYQGTNVGQLVVTSDPSSPAIQTVQVSTAAQTQNVPLAIYDIKSQNQPGTLQTLTIGLSLSSSTLPVGNLFANVQLKAAGMTYSASSLSTTSATFTNLSIPLAADIYTPITISATLAQDTNSAYDNTYVTTSLNSSTGISAIDATYNNIPAGNVTLVSNAQTFTASGVSVSGLNESPNPIVATANNGASSTAQFTFTYSLTAGNNPIYVSKTAGTAVTATTTTGAGKINTASVVSNISFRDNDSTNDGSTYFYIAPGQTKTFTLGYGVSALPGTVGGTYSITNLNYGITSSGTGGSLSASTIANALYATLSI